MRLYLRVEIVRRHVLRLTHGKHLTRGVERLLTDAPAHDIGGLTRGVPKRKQLVRSHVANGDAGRRCDARTTSARRGIGELVEIERTDFRVADDGLRDQREVRPRRGTLALGHRRALPRECIHETTDRGELEESDVGTAGGGRTSDSRRGRTGRRRREGQQKNGGKRDHRGSVIGIAALWVQPEGQEIDAQNCTLAGPWFLVLRSWSCTDQGRRTKA